jgi:hypothetical protein
MNGIEAILISAIGIDAIAGIIIFFKMKEPFDEKIDMLRNAKCR